MSLDRKAEAFKSIIKVGRTHTRDATPLTLGQELSGYSDQIRLAINRVNDAMQRLYPLAQGGTAVGTGLNSPIDFAEIFAKHVASLSQQPFTTAPNKFEAVANQDGLVEFSGALNTIAVSLNKIANDIRYLSSGPRAGLSELILPANEPGSSIMPGKVNPTQVEALTMACAQVFGNHTTITFAGAQGQFELNTFRPVVAYNILQSIRLLSDGVRSFATRCIDGIEANESRIREFVAKSPMLVTALSPYIGYDACVKIVVQAERDDSTIRDAAVKLGLVTEAEFDRWVRPEQMLAPSKD